MNVRYADSTARVCVNFANILVDDKELVAELSAIGFFTQADAVYQEREQDKVVCRGLNKTYSVYKFSVRETGELFVVENVKEWAAQNNIPQHYVKVVNAVASGKFREYDCAYLYKRTRTHPKKNIKISITFIED